MTGSNPRRILIVGDSGRGKSTFAKRLAERLGLGLHSTDDYYWQVKYTVPAPREESIEAIVKTYAEESWLVEGSTRHLVQPGLDRAEKIYLFEFRWLPAQWWSIWKRHLTRPDESLWSFLQLIRHVTLYKLNRNYRSHLPRLREMLAPHWERVVVIQSFAEANAALDA
jgi:hypothetical protein